ncbi:hypothetical protein B0H14DRAFT_3858332 [Mycena olivaceomarginata]|nr:hypothetical protein B0H14DRAFT_3858332 [Mycena olivaceomarginata]
MSPSRRSARLAALASRSNKEYVQGQQDVLPALLSSRAQLASTTRKRTTTDSERGVDETMRKRLHVQPEIGSPSAPAPAMHMDRKGVYLPRTALQEIPPLGAIPLSPGGPYFTNTNVMTPLHILPRRSLDSSTGQEGRDDFSVTDILRLPLNHSEVLLEQQRLVAAYFYALPILTCLRVSILRNTGAEPTSVLGRGTPVDRARADAWGGKGHGGGARCPGNGTLRHNLTPRAPMRPRPPGQRATGVGRGTPVDRARRAAWSSQLFTACFDTKLCHETSKKPCY